MTYGTKMQNGFIKLHRQMTDWEWWDDLPTFRLFVVMLFKANHKAKKWRGLLIKRGQFVSGRIALAESSGLSEQQVRTAISKLVSTQDVTIKTTNKYTLYTIENYSKYQDKPSLSTSNITNNQPTNNQQITTNKNDKKEKNDKNIYAFDDFWDDYDKKRSRPKCEKKWESISNQDKELIRAYIPKYKQCQPDKRYRKDPYTFLNNQSWHDELIEVKDEINSQNESRSSNATTAINDTNDFSW